MNFISKFIALVKKSILKNLRVLISNMTITCFFFFDFIRKIPKESLLDPKFRIYSFYMKFLRFQGANFKYEYNFIKFNQIIPK